MAFDLCFHFVCSAVGRCLQSTFPITVATIRAGTFAKGRSSVDATMSDNLFVCFSWGWVGGWWGGVCAIFSGRRSVIVVCLMRVMAGLAKEERDPQNNNC